MSTKTLAALEDAIRARPEHPCPQHLSWAAIIGILTTGAAAGVPIVYTITQLAGA